MNAGTASEPASGANGTVTVSVNLSSTVAATWSALTLKKSLDMWFGTADRSLAAGQTTRVDFDDGDFFDIETRTVAPLRLVEFDWRFLGVGPAARIRWELRPTPYGCAMTVVDHEDQRSDAAVRELRAGWRDFLGRLGHYLHTGQNSRYDWRDEIDGAVDLPADGQGILEQERLFQWLPVSIDGFEPRWFYIVDDEGPRQFEIIDWQDGAGTDVAFRVLVPEADQPTDCMVSARPTGAGVRVSFRHAGWRDLGLSDQRARTLRARFAAAWTAALEKAAEVSADQAGGR
jgi:uncharacterized protein YndB with AHSA1/START domain